MFSYLALVEKHQVELTFDLIQSEGVKANLIDSLYSLDIELIKNYVDKALRYDLVIEIIQYLENIAEEIEDNGRSGKVTYYPGLGFEFQPTEEYQDLCEKINFFKKILN